jgi:hypothetical protein
VDRLKGRRCQIRVGLNGTFRMLVGCFMWRSFLVVTNHLIVTGGKVIVGCSSGFDWRH